MTMPRTPTVGGGTGRGGNRLTPGSQPLITNHMISPTQGTLANKSKSPTQTGGSDRGSNHTTPRSQPLNTETSPPPLNSVASKSASPTLNNNKRPLIDAFNTHAEKYMAIACPEGIHFTNITNRQEDMDTSEGRTVGIRTDNPQYDNWAQSHELNLKTCLEREQEPTFNEDNNKVFSNMYTMLKLNCIAHNNQRSMFTTIQTSIEQTNERITQVDTKLDEHKTSCDTRFKQIEDSIARQETDRQNRVPVANNTLCDVVAWNNKLLADMRKAERHGRIFGLTPNNRQEAIDQLDDFMTKVYNVLGRGNIPKYSFWSLERQKGTNAPIVVFDANPDVVSYLPTLGSSMYRVYPSAQNSQKSLVYVQEEVCGEFRPMRRRFHLLSRDMRAIDGGYTRIKARPEALSLYLSYRRDKLSAFKPIYSYKPKYAEDPADKHPLKYHDNSVTDYIALSVLFRPERYQKLNFDKQRLSELLNKYAHGCSIPNIPGILDIRARDGTVIGYRIEFATLKQAEDLFEKCGNSLLQKGIETTHYGRIFEKQKADDNAA